MKRLAAALVVVGAPFMASGLATATPPQQPVYRLDPNPVGHGETFTATLLGCNNGEVVLHVGPVDRKSSTCSSTGGDDPGFAAVELTAPEADGSYEVVAQNLAGVTITTATLDVEGRSLALPPGDLAATGAERSTRFLHIASGLLVAGFGLTTLARHRLRSRRVTA